MPVILATDLIVYFIVASIIYFAFAARGEGAAAAAWRSLKKNRLALLCMAILGLYLFVALLDSVRYRDPVTGEDGAPVKTADGREVWSPQALSLLERSLSGMMNNTEKTYSAPFADKLFAKEGTTRSSGTREATGSEPTRSAPTSSLPPSKACARQ